MAAMPNGESDVVHPCALKLIREESHLSRPLRQFSFSEIHSQHGDRGQYKTEWNSNEYCKKGKVSVSATWPCSQNIGDKQQIRNSCNRQ